MAKFGLAALAVVAALALSFGMRSSTPTANADVEETRAVWCGFIDSIADCDDGVSAADVTAYALALGDEEEPLTASDLDDVDLDANQVTDGGAGNFAEILLFAFVDDDGAVTFGAETGGTIAISEDGGVDDAAPADDADEETCDGDDDEDCGTTIDDDGDGVVVATFTEGSADPGDTVDVDIEQDGAGNTETINVVGASDEITLTLVESTIQTDADNDCDDIEVTDGDALSNPDSTVAIAVVTDDDGVELTRMPVTLTSDDDDIASPGTSADSDTSVTVDGGDSGIAYFAVVCGRDETGEAVLTATDVLSAEDADATVTVVGEPANVTLAANPAAIACDGTQTSTVTATVTDSEGNNVANGTAVTFSVVALGTANPINTTTTDGTASSTITPLSGATAGVTVIVSSGGASTSIRVDCSLPVPTPTTPGVVATPTRPGGISGPDTGNGGYLGQDSSAGFPLWTLVALGLGSFALVAGGMVTRRAGR